MDHPYDYVVPRIQNHQLLTVDLRVGKNTGVKVSLKGDTLFLAQKFPGYRYRKGPFLGRVGTQRKLLGESLAPLRCQLSRILEGTGRTLPTRGPRNTRTVSRANTSSRHIVLFVFILGHEGKVICWSTVVPSVGSSGNPSPSVFLVPFLCSMSMSKSSMCGLHHMNQPEDSENSINQRNAPWWQYTTKGAPCRNGRKLRRARTSNTLFSDVQKCYSAGSNERYQYPNGLFQTSESVSTNTVPTWLSLGSVSTDYYRPCCGSASMGGE